MLQKFSKEKFYKIDLIGNSDKQSPTSITHYFVRARDDSDKVQRVVKIISKELNEDDQCIIFVNRKDETQIFNGLLDES